MTLPSRASPTVSRVVTGMSALALAGLGAFFVRELVANDSDNAYAGLAIIGVLLLVAALPFALASLLPRGALRRGVVTGSLVLLGIVGLLGLLILIPSVAMIPFQDYGADAPVLRNHLVGLGALVGGLVVVGGLVYRSTHARRAPSDPAIPQQGGRS